MTASPRRVISLDAVRADGWFDELGEGAPNFAELCRIVGERFVAFAVLAGVRITSITVDRSSPDATLVDFQVGEEAEEHRLALGEFRRRLAATLLADEPTPEDLPASPTADDIQAYIGFRYVLLSPIFGVRLEELRLTPGEPPRIAVDLGPVKDDLALDEFREIIKERIRTEVNRTRSASPFAIDLGTIPKAEAAAQAQDWAGTIELLGAWPGPLSMLLRTHEGQSLAPDVKAMLARALGYLGTAYVKSGRYDWAEEVMRLGIQWGQDSPAAGDLFRRLAEAFVERGRHGEAIGLFRRALSLGAKHRDVLPCLGLCYAERGRFVAAAVCADEAIEAGAPAAEVREVRERALAHLGDAWAAFRELVPSSRTSATTIAPPDAQ